MNRQSAIRTGLLGLSLLAITTANIQAYPTGLDEALEAENREKGVTLKPASPVSDLVYLRRVMVDLIGRIPTDLEIQKYLSWPQNERRSKIVENLLKRQRFSGRWTVFFGDMMRLRSNAEGGAALTAFVYKALSDGMPYDQLVRRMIATNGKAGQTPEVGFVLGDNADPMALAGVTSQVFMGVRIACAQCHDHPFDKWTRKDFYGFAAYFGKTRRLQRRFGNRILATYTSEVAQTNVLWPPQGVGEDAGRKPIKPAFPIEIEKKDGTRKHFARLNAVRAARLAVANKKVGKTNSSIDDLLGKASKKVASQTSGDDPDLLNLTNDAKRDVRQIAKNGAQYEGSRLRSDLADLVTSPGNRYFSRAIVNRVWKELIGRGFVEPIDDFSDRNKPSHPKTLDYLSDEFVASGYDFRQLIRMIVSSDIYQRSHIITQDEKLRVEMESAYLAVPMRRMISEALYDSIVTAGRLSSVKHIAGKNLKTVWRQSRIMKQPGKKTTGGVKPMSLAGTTKPKAAMKTPNTKPGKSYSVENAIELDFEAILKRGKNPKLMVDSMKVKSKEELEAERMQQETRKQNAEYIDRFVKAIIDDNPRFGSSLKMASPAVPEHFLRVFGQPGRTQLGDFRDEMPSMRQALILLNGRLTNEASRVGELEPVYPLIVGKKADISKAIRLVYREVLTREATTEELADAKEIVSAANSQLKGVADLRWVLLNSNEFRFLP